MSTLDAYQDRCEQLFVAGGSAAVRRAAQEGIDALGPHPDLSCWLALGHVVEDEDDHDDEAERAFRAGLALDPDHLGLLAGYAELCRRADGFDHPGRAGRAAGLARRLRELAPPDSPKAERPASAAERWARRGYWDDVRMRRAEASVRAHDNEWNTEAQARALAEDLARGAGSVDASAPAGRDAHVRAATVEALSGPWNAPVRLLGRNRTAAWAVSMALAFATNLLLREWGYVYPIGLWGWLWLAPVLLVDRRFAAARREAEARHLAALEAALAERGR
ncbi:hypothetical protein ACIRSU_11975 [Streptomyces sp. NPDC101160]|uniref:hypothetical protein n=1 Tax=Streptomyces sp. NPDC101160 TaxID=3366118 RepID=UPI0037F335A8